MCWYINHFRNGIPIKSKEMSTYIDASAHFLLRVTLMRSEEFVLRQGFRLKNLLTWMNSVHTV